MNKSIFVINIGWVDGNYDRSEKVYGSKKYPNGIAGHEVFNFKKSKDGSYYAYIPHIKKDKLGRIKSITKLGANKEDKKISNVFVIVTSLNKTPGQPRKLIGYYEDATVFSEPLESSRKVKGDKVLYYIKAEKAKCFSADKRPISPITFAKSKGDGHMSSESPIWYPDLNKQSVLSQINKTMELLGKKPISHVASNGSCASKSSGTNATSKKEYTKVVDYIGKIENKHASLEKSFKAFLESKKVLHRFNAESLDNNGYIDCVFKHNKEEYTCELKPTVGRNSVKYAIRLAIGQLFEYVFVYGRLSSKKVIVLQDEPDEKQKAFLKDLKILYLYETGTGIFKGNIF